jgi:hypothetical protein
LAINTARIPFMWLADETRIHLAKSPERASLFDRDEKRTSSEMQAHYTLMNASQSRKSDLG